MPKHQPQLWSLAAALLEVGGAGVRSCYFVIPPSKTAALVVAGVHLLVLADVRNMDQARHAHHARRARCACTVGRDLCLLEQAERMPCL